MNLNSPVCRTCLGIISEGKIAYNIDDENGLIKNVRNIRDMIMFCVPEMDIYVSVSPSICDACLNVLVNVYNYKIRCMRVENAIRSYIVANNVMEGSCVDLSNVVRQQILDALQQKNWPPHVVQEYIAKVDKCLNLSRRPNIPQEILNVMSEEFSGDNSSGDFVSMTAVHSPSRSALNVSQLSKNLSENSPALNQLLNNSFASPTEVSSQNKKYLSISKNLMPIHPETSLGGQFRRLNPNPIQRTPNLTRHGPPSLPTARPGPSVENYQSAFLNTLNLISTSSLGRDEAVLIRPQPRQKRGYSTVTPCTKDDIHSNTKNRDIAIKVSQGMVCRKVPNKMYVNKSKVARDLKKIEAPKSKMKTNNLAENDTVIILDDHDVRSTIESTGEKIVMNFDEVGQMPRKENLPASSLPLSSKSPEVLEVTAPTPPEKKDVAKVPQIAKETIKRILKPEEVIEEIQLKRRKLRVHIDPNLPYLHTKKKLIVKLRRDRFFKCVFCKFTTAQPKLLRAHYPDWHKVCRICHFRCNSKIALDRHIDTNHPNDFKEALKRYEGEEVQFDCYLCGFIGISTWDLQDHRMRVHIKGDIRGMFKCPFAFCDKEDAIVTNLIRHIEMKHDKIRKRECPVCIHTVQSQNLLKKHVESHILAKKIICPLCGVTCKTVFGLERHKESRHPEAGEDNVAGMAYVPMTSNLIDEDGRITLNSFPKSVPRSSAINTTSMGESSIFDQLSLSEILCTQTFQEIMEQQENSTTVLGTKQSPKKHIAKRKRVILNKRNKKSQKTVPSDDPEDCIIISESHQEIMTVDSSDEEPSVVENPKKKRKICDSDVIEIIDEDCIPVTPITEKSKRPDESKTTAYSEKGTCSGIIANQSVDEATTAESEKGTSSGILANQSVDEASSIVVGQSKEKNSNNTDQLNDAEKTQSNNDLEVAGTFTQEASSVNTISNQNNTDNTSELEKLLEECFEESCNFANTSESQKVMESSAVVCSDLPDEGTNDSQPSNEKGNKKKEDSASQQNTTSLEVTADKEKNELESNVTEGIRGSPQGSHEIPKELQIVVSEMEDELKNTALKTCPDANNKDSKSENNFAYKLDHSELKEKDHLTEVDKENTEEKASEDPCIESQLSGSILIESSEEDTNDCIVFEQHIAITNRKEDDTLLKDKPKTEIVGNSAHSSVVHIDQNESTESAEKHSEDNTILNNTDEQLGLGEKDLVINENKESKAEKVSEDTCLEPETTNQNSNNGDNVQSVPQDPRDSVQNLTTELEVSQSGEISDSSKNTSIKSTDSDFNSYNEVEYPGTSNLTIAVDANQATIPETVSDTEQLNPSEILTNEDSILNSAIVEKISDLDNTVGPETIVLKNTGSESSLADNTQNISNSIIENNDPLDDSHSVTENVFD